MSKGTKQIRLGRVMRLIGNLEIILQILQEEHKRTLDDITLGKITQLKSDIQTLKSEFQID